MLCQGSDEKLYTYTIITTSSNPYLKFLHDRMPVILEPGSEAMSTWLDPSRTTWSKDLQSILKPYEGELECYAVPKEVGKVGNNSPDFIVPVSSKDNKSNIANFFANAKKKEDKSGATTETTTVSPKKESASQEAEDIKGDHEDHAPVPVPGVKRAHTPDAPSTPETKKPKLDSASKTRSPQKTTKMRSATHNSPMKKKPSGTKPTDGSQRITNFFK